ncbi:hypothetical protein [Actinomadura sp. 21ATH]|uniref:effector-associated constant component EACC1 n=1 Tax=Actinomadura sp. 21ATH TaxID=1735444 RepID=UPI0035C20E7C
MAITIRMDGPGADEELRSLHDWLLNDPDIRRHAKISLQSAETRPGQMGGTLEAVQLVVDSGFQTASLVLGYLAWRATRRSKPEATIERESTRIPLSEASEETAESVAKKLDSDGT